MRGHAPRSGAGAVGGAAGDDDLVPGRGLPATKPALSERTRTGPATADAADRQAVLHVYSLECLYAAVVEAYVDW